MSYAIDANVLLDAANEDAAEHDIARSFLEDCAEKSEPLCLAWSVLNAFLRLSTSNKIFRRPLSPLQAREWLEELLNLSQARVLTEEPGFWKLYCEVAAPLNPRGADVTDTHFAALLKQHGVGALCTRDRDFRRFDFLKVIDPFAGGKQKRRNR